MKKKLSGRWTALVVVPSALVFFAVALTIGAGSSPPPASAAQNAQEKPKPQKEPKATIEERQFLGVPAAIVPRTAAHLTLEQGTRIYAEPNIESLVVLRTDVLVEAELIEQESTEHQDAVTPSKRWRKVRVDNVQGWLAPIDLAPRSAAEIWSDPTSADEKLRRERLARLRERFGVPSSLGGFLLYTDWSSDERTVELASRPGESERADLIEVLDRVADGVPGAYARRYGLEAPQIESAAVVLFARQSDYRAYLRDELEMADPGAAGVSPYGLAVLAAEDRSEQQVVAILIHELTHVLNRAWFGDSLPPWLEEGLAEDLSYHPSDRSGRLRLGELPQIERGFRRHFQRDGSETLLRHQFTPSPRIAIACAVREWPQDGGPDLRALTQLAPPEFSSPEGRKKRYAEGAILVRYLLDGAAEETAEAFRRHLGLVRKSRLFNTGKLLSEIGIGYDQLSQTAGDWARAQVRGVRCLRAG